jgi:hypothetical protein
VVPEFQSDLSCVQMTGQTWKLLSPLIYESAGPLGEITVPTGFLTDFASTPRMVWIWMPKSGQYDAAAVLHDWLYHNGGKLGPESYTKAEADSVFEEALKLLGVGQPARWLMYKSVQMFGKGKFT